MAMGAAIANTYRTTGAGSAVGQREDLSDTIDRIDPTDVPFYSNGDKRGARAILTEWQVQELVAPAKNAQPEGFDATFAAAKPTVRLGNYVQLAANSYIVSDTLDSVTTAGRERESTYQALLKGLEIKRDVETSLIGNQIKKGTDPREMASFTAWLTNGSVGATGTMPAGDGSTAAVPGTTRALTLALISDAMQQAYVDGGKPEILMLPTTLKVAFSKLAYPAGPGNAVANEYNMTTVKEAVIIGSVSVFLTDFGRLDVVVNRIMDTANPNCVFLIDPDYYDIATLPGRSFKKTPLAKTGSADKGMMEWEGTLRVTAPKAHAGLFAIIP
jgi:hypothetical protein